MSLKVIITGSTGMVGKAVLLECLASKEVDSILVINRKSLNFNHPKLIEVILSDFSNLDDIKHKTEGYNTCFHCMGVSSIGLQEDKYIELTFDITKKLVDTLHQNNVNMVFNYVSGTRTDSSEKGSIMWARVKGKTENYILNKGFKDAYMFRPGVIIPEKGIKSSTGWYNLLYIIAKPFYGLMKKSNNITTTTKVGQAMINSVLKPRKLKYLENKDINELALI